MGDNPSFDVEVARRQTFGLAFEPRSTDRQVSDEILAGKLSLRPHPAWELPESLTWAEDPFGQRNWRAQLQMLRWLEPVRRVAAAGDQDALAFWLRTVRSWRDANPSIGDTASDYAWADMVDAIRALELVFTVPLVPVSERDWLADLIWEHGEWLADPAHIGKANHALHQHEALFVIGSAFHHKPWIDLSQERLTTLFQASYDEEGINVEGALGYHVNNYLWWQVAFSRLEAEGVDLPATANRLELALEEIVHATRPDGTLERIGDTGTVTPGRLASPEMDYIRSRGATGRLPVDLTKVYKRGYVFGRSGWGAHERDFDKETFYSLSFGPGNRIHGHCDGGSLTLHSNGHPWIIDAGKFSYSADPMTDYSLSRLGHNVLHIEDRKYDSTAAVKLERHSLTNDVDDFTFIDTSYEGVEIRRRVTYCRGGDFAVVIDNVTADAEVTATQRWHLDAGTTPEEVRNGYQLVRAGADASILWAGTLPEFSIAHGETDPYDGWVATDWMKKQAAPVIKASKTGRRFRFITIVAVGAGTFTLNKVVADNGGIIVTAKVGLSEFNVTVTGTGALVSLGALPAGLAFLPAEERLERAAAAATEMRRVNAANLPTIEVFTPGAWAELRHAVFTADDVRDARLEALTILLKLLLADPGVSPDRGLRAALLDLAGADLGPDLGLNAGVLGLNREPLISWPDSAVAVSSTYKTPIQTIETLDELRVPAEGKAIFTLPVGGVLLPMFLGRGTKDVLSVRFHGAINRSKSTLPLFQGIGADSSSGANYLIFQDPTLDLDRDLTLSWYLGDSEINLYEEMARCIQTVQAQVGATSLLLIGNSGGGFAALQVASYLPDSVSLVVAPQTDIHSYFPQNQDRVIAACFGSREALEARTDVAARMSVLRRYTELKTLPRVVYVQNMQDTHHVENHQMPFAAMLEGFTADQREQITFVPVEWGPGHVGMTKERYAEHHATAMSILTGRDVGIDA